MEDGKEHAILDLLSSISYAGRLSDEGDTLTGTWQQGGLSLPLALKRIDEAPIARRPQEPKPPYPYQTEDVVFENRAAGLTLAGTLTLPREEGPHKAARTSIRSASGSSGTARAG